MSKCYFSSSFTLLYYWSRNYNCNRCLRSKEQFYLHIPKYINYSFKNQLNRYYFRKNKLCKSYYESPSIGISLSGYNPVSLHSAHTSGYSLFSRGQTASIVPITDLSSSSSSSSSLSSPSPSSRSSSTPPISNTSSTSSDGFGWEFLPRHQKWDNIILLIQFITFMYFVQHTIIDISSCLGPSMLPTMNPSGDLVFVSRLPHLYERGDVVVASSINNPGQKVCKRIIGLPGDTVLAQPNTSANSMNIPISFNPNYFSSNIFSSNIHTIVVPPGHVWLQGDNLNNSLDSRSYGPVPLGLVEGKVIYKIWPFFSAGPIKKTLKYSQQPQLIQLVGEILQKEENTEGK